MTAENTSLFSVLDQNETRFYTQMPQRLESEVANVFRFLYIVVVFCQRRGDNCTPTLSDGPPVANSTASAATGMNA